MVEMVKLETYRDFDKNLRYSVVVWGTKVAGQICYRILRELNVNIVAAGDNDVNQIGKLFYDIPVLSAQQVKMRYPDALIVVGSFFYDISSLIIDQLELLNNRFSFCRFEEIEYLYETRYLNRDIKDKEKFFRIINNIQQDPVSVWKRKINTKIISEYRYVVQDYKAEYLKKMLSDIYGVKKLLLIVRSEKLKEATELIGELSDNDKIGHIIIVLESDCIKQECFLRQLRNKVFYVICGNIVDKHLLENMGFIVDVKQLPNEMFLYKNTMFQMVLTEDIIINSVLKFVDEKARIEGNRHGQSPVHIVQLFNGLANQMLMVLFGKYLEEESHCKVIFDDTILALDILDEEENIKRISKWNKGMSMEEVRRAVAETRKKNSFYCFERAEVAEVFDEQIQLLSDYFDEKIWRKYLLKVKTEVSKYTQGFPLGQVLLKNGINIDVVRDTILPDEFLAVNSCYCIDAYILDKPCQKGHVTDHIFHRSNGGYYLGIWATGYEDDYLIHNRNWVREQFHFRLELDKRNRAYEREICEADGVVIHIRRGDFVCSNLSAEAKYFSQAIQEVEKLHQYTNKKYFVFSDDLEWCRQHAKELGLDSVEKRIRFVSGNMGENSHIDMYLMSLGKIMIITPGSSFGYVAMLLSTTIEKCIDIPRYFYERKYRVGDGKPSIINI